MTAFVAWYNTEHRHSGIRFVTPDERHDGREIAVLAKRNAVYERARRRNPNRWSRGTRNWTPAPAVFLNPKRDQETVAGRTRAPDALSRSGKATTALTLTAIEVDTSVPALRVVRVLDKLVWQYGLPTALRVDNGPEFISMALDAWASAHGVKLDFIHPGKPTQNGHVESFNGRFRDECLSQSRFPTLARARPDHQQHLPPSPRSRRCAHASGPSPHSGVHSTRTSSGLKVTTIPGPEGFA